MTIKILEPGDCIHQDDEIRIKNKWYPAFRYLSWNRKVKPDEAGLFRRKLKAKTAPPKMRMVDYDGL